MSLNFVEDNKESIIELNQKVATVIKNLNIDALYPLSKEDCIKVAGEVNKLIKSVKSLTSALANVEPGDKAGIILSVTLTTLNSDDVKVVLGEDQRKQLEKFCQDTDTVVSLVDWVADEALESLDINKDGVVTEQELEDGCVGGCLCTDRCGQGPHGCACYQSKGCCTCCPGFVTTLARCWSVFFINILCCKCGKKSVKYEDNPQVSTNKVNV